MEHQRRFEAASVVAFREAGQIKAILIDLNRTVRYLECDIAAEEERARLNDPSHFACPISARTMVTRRDNLKNSIGALELRLAMIGQATPRR
jgi:hypothetical protein